MNTELLILILKYHAGQVRVGNREDGRPDPQIEHIFRVFTKLLQPCDHYPQSLRVLRQNAAHIMLDVALAHDMLEDTEVTEEELAGVLNEYALKSVKALTRDKDQDYFDYIEKQVIPNPLASLVKLADLEDNYETAIPSLQERYSKAKGIILDHWNNVVFPDPAETDYPGEEPGAEKQEEEEAAIVLPD
jgi:(p)ppGpp synthase/HD superfamily hydrolase